MPRTNTIGYWSSKMFLNPISWNEEKGRITRFEGDLRFVCKSDLHGATDLAGRGTQHCLWWAPSYIEEKHGSLRLQIPWCRRCKFGYVWCSRMALPCLAEFSTFTGISSDLEASPPILLRFPVQSYSPSDVWPVSLHRGSPSFAEAHFLLMAALLPLTLPGR